MHILDFQETGSLGAAMLAGVGIGAHHSLEEANRYMRKMTTATTVEPARGKKKLYDDSFKLFQRLYAQTKNLMHELSEHQPNTT